ncbi:uncharacterized protein LOC141903261 [Tubulanus polymorphus]|uniref:uncharacterized protein LOC141903261 n=1 Tax=Tubulanus polymorphus TaxID=672921 RepID=UPI003DA62A3E
MYKRFLEPHDNHGSDEDVTICDMPRTTKWRRRQQQQQQQQQEDEQELESDKLVINKMTDQKAARRACVTDSSEKSPSSSLQQLTQSSSEAVQDEECQEEPSISCDVDNECNAFSSDQCKMMPEIGEIFHVIEELQNHDNYAEQNREFGLDENPVIDQPVVNPINDENLENGEFDIPLYEGASITVGESALLILSYTLTA